MKEPLYDIAAEVSAHIVNTLSDHQGCKSILFGKVLFAVLEGIKEAVGTRYEAITSPAEN